jgi:hypothetical protein
MKTSNYFSIIFLATFLLQGCNKEKQSDEMTCENINKTTVSSNSPVTNGETIHFGTQEVGGYRIYSWTGPDNYANQYPVDSITNAQLENEGWYYLHLFSVNGQCEKFDSVYVDVKLPQGTPPCTINNNSVSFNNLGTDNYSGVTKYIDPNFSQKVLAANAGIYSSLTIYFHTHWRTAEPEDGVYITNDTPVFDQTDNNYNKVFVTATKNSVYWGSNAGQTVYISHAGSKLQARFCDLMMGGNNGVSLTTQASGNVVEQ